VCVYTGANTMHAWTDRGDARAATHTHTHPHPHPHTHSYTEACTHCTSHFEVTWFKWRLSATEEQIKPGCLCYISRPWCPSARLRRARCPNTVMRATRRGENMSTPGSADTHTVDSPGETPASFCCRSLGSDRRGLVRLVSGWRWRVQMFWKVLRFRPLPPKKEMMPLPRSRRYVGVASQVWALAGVSTRD